MRASRSAESERTRIDCRQTGEKSEMLFYASLLIFAIAVSVVAIWLHRALSHAGRKTYHAILPSSRRTVGGRRRMQLDSEILSSLSQRGWSGQGGSRHAMPAGNVKAAQVQDLTSPQVGWPYREESGTGKGADEQERRRLRPEEIRKPWGW